MKQWWLQFRYIAFLKISRTPNTIIVKLFDFLNNHVISTKRDTSVAYTYCILRKNHNCLTLFLLHNIYLSQFLVTLSLRNRTTQPNSRNNYLHMRRAILGYVLHNRFPFHFLQQFSGAKYLLESPC